MINPQPRELPEPEHEDLPVRDLLMKRYELFGHIPAVVEALKYNEPLVIEHVGKRGGNDLGVTVTREPDHSNAGSRTANNPELNGVLVVNGTVTQRDGNKSESFPMYRVTQTVPGTDTGYLIGHLEIAIAQEDGYRPIALVMQSIYGTRKAPVVTGSPRTTPHADLFGESKAQLSSEELTELQETGLYVDPNAQAQLTEVQTIMELVAAQATASPNQPMLPLDFITAA